MYTSNMGALGPYELPTTPAPTTGTGTKKKWWESLLGAIPAVLGAIFPGTAAGAGTGTGAGPGVYNPTPPPQGNNTMMILIIAIGLFLILNKK